MIEEEITSQGIIKYPIAWSTLSGYMAYLERKGIATNIASFVGNGTLRRYVIGYDNRQATSDEIVQMQSLLAQEMQEGAMGISSSLLYEPSRYADTEELVALSQVAARYNGMYISHIRDEGPYLIEAIDELIEISRRAKISAEVYHLKASGSEFGAN